MMVEFLVLFLKMQGDPHIVDMLRQYEVNFKPVYYQVSLIPIKEMVCKVGS